MRINKFLASCTPFSRRKSEQLVLDGKVFVNGKKVENLSFNVDESKDVVTLDGKVLQISEKKVYLMLHKPKGYLCTKKDSKGRKTVFDLISGFEEKRLFSVGRLDFDTEGLLLITNDGDLTNKLIHPKGEIEKTYIAKVEGEVSQDELSALREGVVLDDGFKTSKAKVNLLEFQKGLSKIELVIHEGKNRQIRRMFEAIGKRVIFLKRTKFAFLNLGGISRGEFRPLKTSEINMLKKL